VRSVVSIQLWLRRAAALISRKPSAAIAAYKLKHLAGHIENPHLNTVRPPWRIWRITALLSNRAVLNSDCCRSPMGGTGERGESPMKLLAFLFGVSFVPVVSFSNWGRTSYAQTTQSKQSQPVQLAKARIEGRVFNRDTQRPVPRSKITIQGRGLKDETRGSELTAIANYKGEYVFAGLAPGKYNLSAFVDLDPPCAIETPQGKGRKLGTSMV